MRDGNVALLGLATTLCTQAAELKLSSGDYGYDSKTIHKKQNNCSDEVFSYQQTNRENNLERESFY